MIKSTMTKLEAISNGGLRDMDIINTLYRKTFEPEIKLDVSLGGKIVLAH